MNFIKFSNNSDSKNLARSDGFKIRTSVKSKRNLMSSSLSKHLAGPSFSEKPYSPPPRPPRAEPKHNHFESTEDPSIKKSQQLEYTESTESKAFQRYENNSGSYLHNNSPPPKQSISTLYQKRRQFSLNTSKQQYPFKQNNSNYSQNITASPSKYDLAYTAATAAAGGGGMNFEFSPLQVTQSSDIPQTFSFDHSQQLIRQLNPTDFNSLYFLNDFNNITTPPSSHRNFISSQTSYVSKQGPSWADSSSNNNTPLAAKKRPSSEFHGRSKKYLSQQIHKNDSKPQLAQPQQPNPPNKVTHLDFLRFCDIGAPQSLQDCIETNPLSLSTRRRSHHSLKSPLRNKSEMQLFSSRNSNIDRSKNHGGGSSSSSSNNANSSALNQVNNSNSNNNNFNNNIDIHSSRTIIKPEIDPETEQGIPRNTCTTHRRSSNERKSSLSHRTDFNQNRTVQSTPLENQRYAQNIEQKDFSSFLPIEDNSLKYSYVIKGTSTFQELEAATSTFSNYFIGRKLQTNKNHIKQFQKLRKSGYQSKPEVGYPIDISFKKSRPSSPRPRSHR